MGQTCCSCKVMQQTAPDTATLERRTNDKSSSDDTDFDYDTDTINSTLFPSRSDSDYSTSLTPRPLHTEKSKEKAISGFKDAIKNGNDSLAMYFVQEYPELDLMQLTFEDDDNCLQIAVKNSSYNLIYCLLTNGVSPNEQNKNGETALHLAVRQRHVRVVSLLSKYCADAQITNNQYETPIAIAAGNRDQDIVELLSPDTQTLIRKHTASISCIDENNAMIPDSIHKQTSSAINNIADTILCEDETMDVHPLKNYELAHNDRNTAHIKQESDHRGFEEKLNRSEKLKLEAVRISRTNPFGKLKRMNTKKALKEMQEIADAQAKLPTLAAWLEKKQSSMPYQWQKRWVMVKGSHLLWSDKQRDINDAKNIKERKKFNNSINIMSITAVNAVTKGKTQRKFVMIVGKGGAKSKRKEYTWKCATRQDRDFWVKGLKKHVAHQKSIILYLGTM